MPLAEFTSQKNVIDRLQRSLAKGRLGHAYLFSGQDLGELEKVGRVLTQTLNCQDSTLREPIADACGECISCRKIANDNHPDVMTIKPESKMRQVKIGQIIRRPNSPPRVLHELIYQKSVEGGYKVALLVAADRLNTDAANALLKTLEEPPDRTVFILLSAEPERVLETICSRCLRVRFAGDGGQAFNQSEMDWVKEFALMAAKDDKGLFGRYRLLDSLLQCLAEVNQSIETEVEQASPLSQYNEAPSELREQWEAENKEAIMAEYRLRRAGFLAALQSWLRDVWLQTRGEDGGLEFFSDLSESTQIVARRLTHHDAEENLQIIEQTQRTLHTNVGELLALETGLMKLKL